ncbi:tRNA (guanine37-N1)-methyltransferase [Actinomadura luteofluorescens]|uniref:tRNA (guanine-N(1)-)-methyltransferase n=1 Tax=Actinomadura luteofluorescens TaxID=46163 RepID=A0A7Y9JEJ1_9ACTN|nr:tRNA (guanine37-N1)-methyltransferase [Actinomadura luteofluorescens]
MRLDVITIFPEYFAPLEISLLGKARRAGLLDVRVHDLREWTHDRHRTVDDTPYGGGPGMVMKPDPWGEALDTLAPPPNPPTPGETSPPSSADAAGATYPGAASADGLTPGLPPGGPAAPRAPGGTSAEAFGATPAGGISAAGPVPHSPSGGPGTPHVPGETSPPSPSATYPGGASAAGAMPGPPPGGPATTPVSAERPPASLADAAGATSSGGASPAGAVPRLIIPTPSGRPFTQADAVRYAAEPWLIFACGRYEGIDSRVAEEARTRMPVDEVSLGDFVLAGGEVAVLVMVEAIGRLLPGVLGNADSVADDSFAPGAMESLLEGPVYTKPPVWRERPVPDILLSGHHGAIARWRRDEALRRTARHRPELLSRLTPEALDKHDRAVLREAGFPVDGEDMAD